MSKESIQGPLTALRNAGTVCGVCLMRRTETVVNLFPFSEDRMNEVIALIDDIILYLEGKGRQIDQLCFGYDGGNLVIITDDDYRLVVMHTQPDEIDFIAKAARAFLIDFQVGLFAEQLNGENARLTQTGMVRELPPVVIPGETPEPKATAPSEGETTPPRIEVIHRDKTSTTDTPPVDEAPENPEADSGSGNHLAASRPESSIPLPRKRRDPE